MSDTYAYYEVTITHPDLDGPLVIECPGMTKHAAIARARATAFHLYREPTMLIADATAVVMS